MMGTGDEGGVGIGTAEWEVKLRQWCVEQALHIAAPHGNADDVLMQAEELRVWVLKRADEQKKAPADTVKWHKMSEPPVYFETAVINAVRKAKDRGEL